MKRKILSLILVFTMILSLMTPIFAMDKTNTNTYSAQSEGPRVIVKCHPYTVTNEGTYRNDEFEIEVFVKNVQDLYGAGVSVKYDPAIFEVVEDSPGAPFDINGCILTGFGSEADSETEEGDYYIAANNYDSNDPSTNIMHFAITGVGEQQELNVGDSWGKIVEVSLRVRDDYSIDSDHSIDFATVHSIQDLYSAEITNAIAVELSDSKANPITFNSSEEDDGTIEIYFEEEINGEISLDWTYQGHLDLDGQLIVPGEGEEVGVNVGWQDSGASSEYPWAVFLQDESTYDMGEGVDSAKEEILYNKLIPGSKYVVYNCEETDLSQLINDNNTSITVQLDDTHTFDIDNASGSGIIWHVFDVTDDDNNEIVEIVTVNKLINEVNIGPKEPEICSWKEYDTEGNLVSIDGYVFGYDPSLTQVELYINNETFEPNYTTTIDIIEDDGFFSFDTFELESGLNIIKVQYDTDEWTISESMYEINADYICNIPTHNGTSYSGDIDFYVFEDNTWLNADFDAMKQVYGEIFRVNPVTFDLESNGTLTFNLNEDKYSAVTSGINFVNDNEYIIKFYDENSNQIGIAYFGIDPTVVVTSDWWWLGTELTDLTLSGYLAFADDYLTNNNSFKIFINGDSGTDISLDSNGNFNQNITLNQGNNKVKLVFTYDNDSTYTTDNDVYVGPENQKIGQPTILSLNNQTDSIWIDGLTQEELEAITVENPSIGLDIELPDDIGIGYYGTDNSLEGYWLYLQVEHNNGNIACSTMSPVMDEDINDGIKGKLISTSDLLENLVDGAYNIYAQIILYEEGENIDESEYSSPVEFTYSETTQLNSDATLSDLTVDGPIDIEFSPDILNYEVTLPVGTTVVPTVSATLNDTNAKLDIIQANELPGTAIVVVTAEDEETTKTYSVEFDIEASDIKTDTILSFDAYKAEKKHQTVGSVTYTYYEKGLEVNNENTLRPGDYVYVDIYAENIINSLGVDLNITFDDNVLTVVNDEFTKKPFRIGLTEAGYITGFSKQEGINEVREGNSIKYVSGTDTAITEDNKPIGYIIFQVNLGVEGETTLSFDTAKLGWQEEEEIIDYNVGNQDVSLKVVDSIDVKFEYLGDSPLVGAKISVYNESDDITSDNPINIYDVINGMVSFSNLDPNTQYQFVLDAPQYLTKSITYSLNSISELDFGKIYAGDLNDDDVIGLSDFLTLIQNYDTSNDLGDLNRDSEVGLSDFLTLIQNYDMKGSTYK